MSQQPAHKRRPDATRDAIWKQIRSTKGGQFTARQIWEQLGATKNTVREYLTGLLRAGHIKKVGELNPGSITAIDIYELDRDCGVEAPRVRRDGSAVTMGRGRENMWRTLKINHPADFSARQLAVEASTDEHRVTEVEAGNYLHHLHKAGYVQMTAPAVSGKHAIQARYRLIKAAYTGPKPPQVQRINQVYDPNTGKVVWRGGTDDNE
jgi:hypothetical protein